MTDKVAQNLSALKTALEDAGSEFAPYLSSKSFEGRLAFQKIAYLAQRLGAWEGEPINYGRYVRGPYSPRLAMAYFELDTKPGQRVVGNVKLETAQLLAKWLDEGVKFLEAMASIDATILLKKGANLVQELPEAEAKVRARKPFLTKEITAAACDELRALYERGAFPGTAPWVA